jgi:TonB family protein
MTSIFSEGAPRAAQLNASVRETTTEPRVGRPDGMQALTRGWLIVAFVASGGAAWAVETGRVGPLSFDPRGADFTLWVEQFKDQVYQHWPPRTGVPAGARGRVVLRFTVARNGALQDIRVKRARGARELQPAAQEALRAIRCLPLPAGYKREGITMSLDFYLNEEPPGAVQTR